MPYAFAPRMPQQPRAFAAQVPLRVFPRLGRGLGGLPRFAAFAPQGPAPAPSTLNTVASSMRSGVTLDRFFNTSGNYGIFNDYQTGQYLKVDFGAGAAVGITSATYTNAVGANWAPTSVLVQSSPDGTTWTTEATYSDNSSTTAQPITVATTTVARYWRLYQNSNTRGNGGGYEWHFFAFSMAGTLYGSS